MMKRRSKKPSGTIGPIIMRTADQKAEFQPLSFPKDKEKLEKFIVKFVTHGLRKSGHNPYKLTGEPIQNPESDYDFTLQTVSGTEYLELMEVAPLEGVVGSYQNAPGSYNHGELADFIYDKLIAKSTKYRTRFLQPIHLLLYTTDWRFRVSGNVLFLVGYRCQQTKHNFKTIIYFAPDDATHGEAKILYPLSLKAFKDFEIQAARRRISMLADPTRINVKPDGSVEIPLMPPKKRLK